GARHPFLREMVSDTNFPNFLETGAWHRFFRSAEATRPDVAATPTLVPHCRPRPSSQLVRCCVAVAFVLVGAGAAAQQVGEGIRWDAGRRLQWSDFRGPVDPDAGPRAAALTAASVSLGYELEVRTGRRCDFEVSKIETAAEFHPEHSWVREGARTDAVLEHEQG